MTSDPLYHGYGSNFFDDQPIFVQDLQNIEYTKIRTIRDTIAACISQPGVAIDSLDEPFLKVAASGSEHFTINAGTAIDKYGRIIYVPEDTSASGSVEDDPYYHPTWPSRIGIPHRMIPNSITVYYVNIYYTTQQDISKVDDKGDAHYIREYDSYYVAIETTQASEESGGICLASFQVNSSGEIVGDVTDLRPLLLLDVGTGISSALEVFKQVGWRWRTTVMHEGPVNGFVGLHRYLTKAVFSYRYRGESTMIILFDVPDYTECVGRMWVHIFPACYGYENCDVPLDKYPCSSGSIISDYLQFPAGNPGSGSVSYSSSFDVGSLSQDSLYVVALTLGALGENIGDDAYAYNTIIEVS